MPDKPVSHGTEHRPGGFDASWAGIWHLVGSSDVFAGGYTVAFLAGANMAPTAGIPNPVPMRFRLAVGPPNVLTYNYSNRNSPVLTGISWYTDHQIEIQGDVTGVNPGDIVFILPIEYTHDHDVPCHAHDDNGNYIPCRLLSTGEFIYDVP